MTFDPADELNFAWSPDASHIAFSSARKGILDLYQKANGAGAEHVLVADTVKNKYATHAPAFPPR
jgi:Tol biopolymer transport system component